MNFFLTLDLEDWYHLDYFTKYSPDRKSVMVPELKDFFDLLDKFNIKITVFVLAELLDKHADVILDISNRGHEIGVHGWNHDLLHEKSNDDFIAEISRAKLALQELTGQNIVGYRAPCFSMSNEKLSLLPSIGIIYDSSYIKFNDHPLYGDLSMKKFNQIDSTVWENNGFYEFELPTVKVFGKNLPISGGGYFRFFPKFIFKKLWNSYIKESKNFNFYIHPFELTEIKVDLKNIHWKDKLRFRIGRKNNLKKLEWFINYSLKKGFKYTPIREYLNSLNDKSS